MTRRLLLAIAGLVVMLCVHARPAAAASGIVQGRLMFYNAQGNYCPMSGMNARDCTGSKYPETQAMTNLGVSDTKVYLRNIYNQVIGQGTTDSVGNYFISWFDSNSGPVQAYIVWHLEHKDGRFVVHAADGSNLWFMTAPIVVSSYSNFGTLTWGTASAPNLPANVFNGAVRTWRDSFSQSNLLVSYFGGLDIRFGSNQCSTSCANGILNMIWLDPDAPLAPQSRIMHEMGHIASVKASSGHARLQASNIDCYPAGGGGCGWQLASAEWGALTFEEALATFFGDAALYYQNARQPHTCFGTGPCATNAFNTETSSGIACATDANRQPLNNLRYLWDLYDTNQDYPNETLSMSVGQIADAVNQIPDGYDNGGKNEPFSPFFNIDDADGRSSQDFSLRLMWSGTQNITQLMNNCGAVGD